MFEILAVTMQSDRARLLDLFAQEVRLPKPATNQWPQTKRSLREKWSSFTAYRSAKGYAGASLLILRKNLLRIAFLPTALLRLSGVDRAAQARSEARNGNSCAPRDVGGNGNT